jgi:hypothetical protein
MLSKISEIMVHVMKFSFGKHIKEGNNLSKHMVLEGKTLGLSLTFDFVNINNILTSKQPGFDPNLSAISALLKLTNDIYFYK